MVLRGLELWLQVTMLTLFAMGLREWRSLALILKKECFALLSSLVCVTKSPFLLVNLVTVCTSMFHMVLSTRFCPTFPEEQMRKELVRRLFGGQLFYKPQGVYKPVGME